MVYQKSNSQLMRISCVQIFNLASALVGMMVVDKLGRRKIFLISNIGMLTGQHCSLTLDWRLIICPAFSMWTVTTALFSQSGNVVAARGMFNSLHIRWCKLMIQLEQLLCRSFLYTFFSTTLRIRRCSCCTRLKFFLIIFAPKDLQSWSVAFFLSLNAV